MRDRILRIAVAATIGLAGIFSLWLGAASAQNFRSGNSVNVGSGETIDSSLWVSGRSVDIAGQVNGDVYCAGQNVTVSGTIRGDLLCAAQTIVISGVVTGDVRTAAQNATLNGTVIHNFSSLSQSFNQSSKGNVRGDLSAAANDITVNGPVGRDAALAAQTVFLGSEVGRNVEANTTDLSVGSAAKIKGNLNYTSQNNAHIASGAVVQGKTTKTTPSAQPQKKAAPVLFRFNLAFGLFALAAAVFTTLILALFFPQALHTVSGHGVRSFWKSLLVGLVAAIVVPAVILVLMITIIGIPLALLLLGAWLLVQALAGVFSAYFLGRIIWRGQRNVLLIMLLGTVLLVLLYFIPVVGFLAFVLAMLLGVGMLLLELNRRRAEPRYTVGS